MAMEKSLTSVSLTDEDARLFLLFREHQNDFLTMVESGVFKVRNGVAILNFNSDSQLTQIDFNIVRYKKGMVILAM